MERTVTGLDAWRVAHNLKDLLAEVRRRFGLSSQIPLSEEQGQPGDKRELCSIRVFHDLLLLVSHRRPTALAHNAGSDQREHHGMECFIATTCDGVPR